MVDSHLANLFSRSMHLAPTRTQLRPMLPNIKAPTTPILFARTTAKRLTSRGSAQSVLSPMAHRNRPVLALTNYPTRLQNSFFSTATTHHTTFHHYPLRPLANTTLGQCHSRALATKSNSSDGGSNISGFL